jgi:hypothetical protein
MFCAASHLIQHLIFSFNQANTLMPEHKHLKLAGISATWQPSTLTFLTRVERRSLK